MKQMQIVKSLALAAVMALSSVSAQGAVLGVFTYTYGTGQRNPEGTDTLASGYVRVADNSAVRFRDVFDFSSVGTAVIDSLQIMLSFTGAGTWPAEYWTLRVAGSNAATSADDYFSGGLLGVLGVQSFTLDASTDMGSVNAFLTSVTNRTLDFGFSEFTNGTDNFRLSSAVLTVNGTVAAAAMVPSTVPLPAPGLMLLSALGALALWRRRRCPVAIG